MTVKETAAFLRQHDNYLILTHKRPDGDTIGCAAALCEGLRALGRTAWICPHTEETHLFTPYLEGRLAPEGYVPETVVSVDIAARSLFTRAGEPWLARGVDLAIDHHPSQEFFAAQTCLDAGRAACGELIYDILRELGPITPAMAVPLYVAVSTDTGCFQYSNTTADTHRVAAALMETGMDVFSLNKRHFRTKSWARLQVERLLTERMMHMPWREFVTDYLAGEHGAVHLVAGHDFHFGYKGEGNPERLQALCGELGIGCDIIPKVVQDHITISSTYIRTLVAQGEMERANQFLGHPHTLTDTVAHGKKLGGTLGFPTVNLRFQPGVLVPAHGVYATRVTFENGESRPAVTNIGVRPTVDDGDRVTVEGFILDFQGDLYGQTVRMEFYKRLRGERKFPSLEALKDEVMRNAEQTRAYFSTQP